MYKWGARSKKVRGTLDPRLQLVVDELLKLVNVSLISGHRGQEEQDRLYEEGKTQVKYPNSKHNTYPSIAVDIQPYPYPINEEELWGALGFIAGLAICIGMKYNIELRWGGDWNQNGSLTDNNFDDLFHLEIVEKPHTCED